MMNMMLKAASLFLLAASHLAAFDIVQIPNLGGTPPNVDSFDINNSNFIVGSGFDEDHTSHAFRYDLNNNILLDLATIPGIGPNSEAHGINSRGDIVGLATFDGFFLAAKASTAQLLPHSDPTALLSSPQKINTCRTICGFDFFISDGDIIFRPVVFDLNRPTIDIGTLPNTTQGIALDVNEQSVIVGFSFNDD